MTMEDRTGGIDRAAPATSTTATTAMTSANACTINDCTSDASYPLQRAGKRSFDVAFLVAPDENLARRQTEKLRLISSRKERVREELSMESSLDMPDKLPQNLTIKHYDSDNASVERRKIMHYPENSLSPPYVSPRTLTPTLPGLSPDPDARRSASSTRLQKTPSPPGFPIQQTILSNCPDPIDPVGLTCGKIYESSIACPSERHGETRSAFTKVSMNSQRNGFSEDGQTSPRSSISPDDRTSYQSSVSPPVVPMVGTPGYKYAPFPAKMAYPFLVAPESSQSSGLLDNLKIPQIAQPPKIPSPKVSTFRPDLPPVYTNIPYNPISVFPPMAEALARPRFLATAASLLPPSFAALTLPAQNVCAKCNLSFRMTSDLVYHMRSHHKNESSGEAARRRREEKLRCPVCDESFRERHHLTRHMTAHQDKESDAMVDQVEVKRRTTTVHSK